MLRYSIAPLLLGAHRALGVLRAPATGFRIVLFHDVPAGQADVFAAFVEYAVAAHDVLTPAEAAGWLDSRRPVDAPGRRRRPLLFTFDDGFQSNFSVAAPVLERHGIRAIFFVAPGLVDLAGDAQRDAVARHVFDGRIRGRDLAPEQRLMSWAELAELKARGHVVGCHGLMHRRLSALAPEDRDGEIVGAGDRLDSALGQRTEWYAYAFGDIASIDADALGRIAGRYRFCRSGLRGGNDAATPPAALLADSLSLSAPASYNRFLVEGGLDRLYRAKHHRLAAMAANPA